MEESNNIIAGIDCYYVYKIFFNRIRIYSIENQSNEVIYTTISHQLNDIFDLTNENQINRSEYLIKSINNLIDGLQFLSSNDYSNCKVSFHNAFDNSLRAQLQSNSYKDQILSSKIRILSILHKFNYFNKSKRNIDDINVYVMETWRNLQSIGDISFAISYQFGWFNYLFQLACLTYSPDDILHHVAIFRGQINDILPQCHLPIQDAVFNREISLLDLNPIVFQTNCDGNVKCMLSSEGLLYAGIDSNIVVFDISLSDSVTVRKVNVLTGHVNKVSDIAISMNRLFSSSYDSTIRVWDISMLDPTSTVCVKSLIGHTDKINSIVINRGLLYSGSNDCSIRIWDIFTSSSKDIKCIHVLKGHSSSVNSLVVCGKWLYSGSSDKTIRIWDITASKPSHIFSVRTLLEQTEISSMATSNNRLLVGSSNGYVRVWDISSNNPFSVHLIDTIKGQSQSSVLAVSNDKLFSLSINRVVVTSWDLFPSLPKFMSNINNNKDVIVTAMICSQGQLITSLSNNTITMRIY